MLGNNILIGASGAGGATGHIIEGSALFDGSSGYLSKTPSSSTTSKTECTLQFIFKPCELDGYLFAAYGGASNSDFFVYYNSAGDIYIKNRTGGSTNFEYHTPNLLRDFSAYYDVVIGIGSAAGDVNLQINGRTITLTQDTAKSKGQTMHIFGNAAHEIGRSPNSSNFFGKYLARVAAIDGTKLTASSFGETTDDGYWQINDVSELFEATQTYFPTSAKFDGSNDGLTLSSNLTGAADGKEAFYSFWVKLNGGDGSIQHIQASVDAGGGDLFVIRHSTNRWYFYAHDAAVSAASWTIESNGLYTASDKWVHVMMSLNGTEEHLYVNGVEDLKSGFTHNNNVAVGAFTAVTVGKHPTAGERLNADIADLIYAQQYIDLSDAANRAKFITTDGFPVAWATSLAAISSPLIAMHLDDGEAVANFANNADGTGQAFTVEGTLTDGSDVTVVKNSFLLEGKSIAAGTDSNVTGYSPGSAVFSGTPYITSGGDLTGISNGNTGLISLWVKFGSDGSGENFWVSHTGNDEIAFYRRSDNTIWVNIADDSDNVDLFLKTSETVTVASGWTHLLVSWDVSAGYSDIYINDVQSSLSLDTTTSGGLDYTHSNHFFFADRLGNDRFNGEVADFWLTVNNTRFELTTESNRRKFISSDGYAVDLGSDGSTPTGTAPLVFFHLDRGEAPANFFANAGTGGTTSLSSSSLTEGSDPNNRHFTPAGTITATNDSPTNGDA